MTHAAESFFTGSVLSRDLFGLVAGDKLGEGMARQVHEYALDSKLVVKFETGARSFQNAAEWEFWTWVRGTDLERWFAPCRYVSACGCILIQDRCEPLPVRRRPKMLPAFMTDVHPDNFGVLGGRVVCFDYGFGLSVIRRTSRRMVKARWR